MNESKWTSRKNTKIRYDTRPISRLYDFQVWLQCLRCHYYLLSRGCLSKYDVRYFRAYIKSHWNDVYLWALQKYRILPIPPARKSFANGQFLQILGWFVRKSAETICRRKISTSRNQKKFRQVEATFAICYYLLMSFIYRRCAGLNFSIFLIWLS